MNPFLNTAIKTVREAGVIMLRAQDNLSRLKTAKKGKNDYVTEADHQVETFIIETLKEAYPDHHFYGEETGGSLEHDEVWIIDPIDGTNNFMRGVPYFSISVALMHKGVVKQGVVYNPMLDEMFAASRGNGAFLNQHRIRVTPNQLLKNAMLATGSPHKDCEALDRYVKSLETLYPQCSAIRRSGSAALDLAYVAAGRYDGFWESGLEIWDIAAGALLVKEAGGIVSDFAGGKTFLETGNIVAATPKLFEAVRSQV